MGRSSFVCSSLRFLRPFTSSRPPANEWVQRVPTILSKTEISLRDFKESFQHVSRAAEQVEQLTDVDGGAGPQSVAVTGPNLTSLLFKSTRELVATAIATIVLVYLLLASGDLFLRKTITVMPRLQDKVHAVDLSRELELNVARYLLTITSINLSLGIVVGIVMHLLGMPNSMLWGMMVALFNFVPYLGALASFAVLTLAAFVSFDSVGRAFTVGGVFFAINAIEAYVVTPAVVGRSMRMNPVAIFVSVIFLGWIWGVSGMLFAVPLLSTLRLCCDHIEPLAPLSEFLSG